VAALDSRVATPRSGGAAELLGARERVELRPDGCTVGSRV
jgi:hypothetical protein